MLAHNAPLVEQLIYCPDQVSIEALIEMAEKADALDAFVDKYGTLADVSLQIDDVVKFTNVHTDFGIDTAVELEIELRALDTLKYRAQDLLDILESDTAHLDDVMREANALRAFLDEISK
jgi:hypothetical protein